METSLFVAVVGGIITASLILYRVAAARKRRSRLASQVGLLLKLTLTHRRNRRFHNDENGLNFCNVSSNPIRSGASIDACKKQVAAINTAPVLSINVTSIACFSHSL